MAGREVFAKRDQLLAFAATPVEPIGFANLTNEDASRYRVTNEYQVTSEYAPRPVSGVASSDTSSNPKSYTVNITSARPSWPNKQDSTTLQRKHKATLEANRAAFTYTKVASLFFVSLLVTWVPSSINRVYSLIYPEAVSIQYAYAAGIVLSLMGFWNG